MRRAVQHVGSILTALGLLISCAAAQENMDQIDDVSPAAEAPRDDGPVAADNPLQREKERNVLAGMAAIAGILIVGVALITLIILWGGRLRRMNREPLTATNVKNEFWFLRPPKPPVSEHGPTSSEEKPP